MEGLAQYLAGDNTVTHSYDGAGSTPKKDVSKFKVNCKINKDSKSNKTKKKKGSVTAVAGIRG